LTVSQTFACKLGVSTYEGHHQVICPKAQQYPNSEDMSGMLIPKHVVRRL